MTLATCKTTPKLCKYMNKSIQNYFLKQARTSQSNTVYSPTRSFSSRCINCNSKFREPRHVPKAAKMSWMGVYFTCVYLCAII